MVVALIGRGDDPTPPLAPRIGDKQPIGPESRGAEAANVQLKSPSLARWMFAAAQDANVQTDFVAGVAVDVRRPAGGKPPDRFCSRG